MVLNGKLNLTLFFLTAIIDATSSDTDNCNTEINNEFAYDYGALFKHYGLNETKFYGVPYFGERNTFHGFSDDFHNLTKCGDIIYVQTEFLPDFIALTHPKILNPYILITHNSDISVGQPQHMEFLNSPKLIAWFGQNVIGRHPKLKMLPIGLPPNNYSVIHEASQNVKPFKQRNLTLYLNFSPRSHPDRPAIQKYIKHKFWGESDVLIADNRTSYNVYLSHLSNAKFIVSPPGGGLDCYRTWEAFIMGAVPIVLRSEISHLYDGLPVMFVDSWTDVKRKNLEKFEQKYLKTFKNGCPPNRPKIWARYWITKIMEFKVSAKMKFCNKN